MANQIKYYNNNKRIRRISKVTKRNILFLEAIEAENNDGRLFVSYLGEEAQSRK